MKNFTFSSLLDVDDAVVDGLFFFFSIQFLELVLLLRHFLGEPLSHARRQLPPLSLSVNHREHLYFF